MLTANPTDNATAIRTRKPKADKPAADPPARSCVTGHRPDERCDVPYIADDQDYYRGDRIEETAAKLLERTQEFSSIRDYRFVYFWKRGTIKKNGQEEYGRLTKPSGMLRHLTGQADYLIEMSAETCAGLANYEFEAAVFHILCHAHEEEHENAAGELTYTAGIRNHEFEGFTAEVTRYGFWNSGLRAAQEPYAKQLKLAIAPDKP